MINVTRTIYGAQLQSNLFHGIPHNPPANSTLNELYNIHEQINLTSTEQPSLNYFGIGNSGHRIVPTEYGGKTSSVGHMARHAGLYRPLPFVLRPIGSDLTGTEQAKYGMRVPVQVGSTWYWGYFLKKLDKSNIESELKLTTITNSVKTTTVFTPDNADLSPPVPTIPNNGVITSDGSLLSTVTALDLSLNAADIALIVDAATIMYNDPEAAIVSEIALVTGFTKLVALLDQNRQPTGGTYAEAIKAQVSSFGGAFHQLTQANDGLTMLVDLGASEPMYGVTPTVVVGV